MVLPCNTITAQLVREIFRAWNLHKAGRALEEEVLYHKGKLGLRWNDKVDQNED